jgi:Sulfotransferase family
MADHIRGSFVLSEIARSTCAQLSPNPSFFIVGVPGSGTTRLQDLINGHPELAVAPDMHHITWFFETRDGLNPDGLMAPELVAKWVEQRRFDSFQIDRDDIRSIIPAGELLDYKKFISRLLDLHGKAQGKRLVGSRTLDYLASLTAIHRLWPKSKFIHLIRDGRDVCAGVLRGANASELARRFSTWSEDPIVTAALWWKWLVRQGREAGVKLGPDLYLEMHYESFRRDRRKEWARIVEFLGAAKTDAPPELLPLTVPDYDSRDQLQTADVERFEAAAGDLLDELGYPRAFPRPAAEVVRRVCALGERFMHEISPPFRSPEVLAHYRRTNNQSNPFVFIVGCPRSGTTLLQRLLDAHPEIAISSETFWIPYYFRRRIGLTPEGLVTPEMVSRLFEYYKFYRMKIARQDLERLCATNCPSDYATLVTEIFDLYGDYRGKALVGDKTPDYVRELALLHELWPNAKFIHLIRDGRDVALSATNWKRKVAKLERMFPTWAAEPVVTAALWWEWNVGAGRATGQDFGSEVYYEIRYEALVADAAAECKKLCAFLGVPFHESMLHFHDGKTRPDPGLDAKSAWQPITPGLRDWRSQMPAPQVEVFEAAAGKLLDELGYARTEPRPSDEAVDRAARIRSDFARSTESLGEWLP